VMVVLLRRPAGRAGLLLPPPSRLVCLSKCMLFLLTLIADSQDRQTVAKQFGVSPELFVRRYICSSQQSIIFRSSLGYFVVGFVFFFRICRWICPKKPHPASASYLGPFGL
jgi:hypothetical protein